MDKLLLKLRMAKIHNRFERMYTRKVYALIHERMTKAGKMLQDNGSDFLKAWLKIDDYDQPMESVLRELYVVSGNYYINSTLKTINSRVRKEEKATRPVGGFGFNPIWTRDIIEYLSNNLLYEDVKFITETTKKRILKILSEGVIKGYGVDKMARMMRGDDLSMVRARMIVRTELAKSRFYATQRAAEESIWETSKEWVTMHDDRVRSSHAATDGKKLLQQQRFKVPLSAGGYDLMRGPGDTYHTHPENYINCRCHLIYAPARDSRGRLVRKRKISVLLPGEINRDRRIVTI